MKKCYLFLCFLVLTSNFLFAQIEILNEPTTVLDNQIAQEDLIPTTPVFATTLTDLLDQVFDSLSTASPIKGFNAAMLLPDGTLWKRAAGLAEELPDSVSLTTDHLMAMGSISKSFVSATLLLMVEDGMLSLDDSIGQYLDEYPNVPGKATIKQLLSHRTGINDYLNENPATINAWGNNVDSIWVADTLLYNYVLEPNFAPGAAWSYSNTNYLLAGRIIENITGQEWYEVVRERVIDPMGLSHTFIYPWETPGAQPLSNAWLDFIGNGQFTDVQGTGTNLEGLYSMATSAGCLISTPEDLVYFSDQLHGGDFVQAATLVEMQTDYLQFPASGLKYGLGVLSFIMGADLENWGHNGSLIYQSTALHFPEKSMSIAVQQNDTRLNQPNNSIIDINTIMWALVNACDNYSPPVAVGEPVLNTGFTIAPNPTGGQFVIKVHEEIDFPLECSLINISGQQIEHIHLLERTTHINLELYPEGMYFLKLGNHFEKIVLTDY